MWEKRVTTEFAHGIMRLDADMKRAVLEAAAELAHEPLDRQPKPVRLLNEDYVVEVSGYLIRYRLFTQPHAIVFLRVTHR